MNYSFLSRLLLYPSSSTPHEIQHHQKESPAHKRALKARLGLTPASTSSSQQDVKPSIAKLSSSSGSGSAPSKSANASSKMQDSKKRAVVELSDDDDDDLPVFVSATQGKTKTPAASQQSSSQASSKASSDGKLPFAPSAPNLSQSQPQNSTTRAASHYKPQWEPMRKRTKFTDLQSAGDSDVTMQSDRESSAESDLVELSTVFGLAKSTEKGKERERVNSSDVENNSGLAYQPRVRTISGDRINATSAGTKSNPTGKMSAFEQLRALQASKNKPPTAPPGGMDVDVKPASSFTSIRDQAPPTSSSSPGYGAKGKEAGMDSGYLSSIADVSSSSPVSKGKERAVDDVQTEYPFFPPYSDVAKSREFSHVECIAVSNIILELKKLKDTAKTCPDFASINSECRQFERKM